MNIKTTNVSGEQYQIAHLEQQEQLKIDNQQSLVAGKYDEFVKKYPEVASELVEIFSKKVCALEGSIVEVQALLDDICQKRLEKRAQLHDLYMIVNKHLSEAKWLSNDKHHVVIVSDNHEKMIKNKLHQYLETQIQCEVLEKEIKELDEQESDVQTSLAEHDLKLGQGKWLLQELNGSINRIRSSEDLTESDEIAHRQSPFPLYVTKPANQVPLRNQRVEELFAKLADL